MTETTIESRVHVHRRSGNFVLDAAFDLPSRGITALFGPSGAGKTTCLRAIAGLERDIDGHVVFAGELWQDSATHRFVPAHRRGIGYVAQEPGLFAHLSVAGNLDYGQRRAGRDSAIDRTRVMEQFGVDRLLSRKVPQLSGGERQRVAIVRAMLAKPKLLLLDEPLAALDAEARGELLGCLEQWHAEFTVPAIYVSHAIDEVARLADHLVVMDAGRVITQGELRETLARGDFPAALRDQLGAVIEGRVVSQDAADQLTEVVFDGGRLWLPRRGERVGDRLRCRINARDAVLTRCPPGSGSSALNVIKATVVDMRDAKHPSQCVVRLDAGGIRLLATITRRSWHALHLQPSVVVWAQVKATVLGA
jgi:molybdate transport system ATP-binding protein